MTKNIMLDLETMGSGNNAAIVAIGAVEFCPYNRPLSFGDPFTIGRKFYEKVSLESSVKAGLVMDASTVLWWLKQSSDAQFATFEGGGIIPLGEACHRFSKFVDAVSEHDEKNIAIWGNGAMFDNVIIRSAFKAVGLIPCWSFRNDKCYRTVINLLPGSRRPPFERSGTAHNALDDAITQAKYLQRVYHELGV